MPELPFSAVRFRCLGECGQVYDSYQRAISHRGHAPGCKGARIDIILPEGVLAEEPAREEEREEGRAEEEKEPKERAPGKRAADTAVYETRPSTHKETLYFPASIRTMFDAFRARFGYTGDFNDWVLECLGDYNFLLGIRVAVVVGTPPGQAPPPAAEPKEEVARAAVS